jgi:O-succinylbenzoate synthase
MLESAVGQSHSLALATLPNVKYPSDLFPSQRYYREDLGVPELALCAPSQMRAPDAPGIGRAPHPQRLARLTVQTWSSALC